MPTADENGNGVNAQVIALQALGWVMADETRAHRFLALTGLDASQLRASAGSTAVLSGVIGFLAAHEPDLVACAEALDMPPGVLAGIDGVLAS